MLGADDAEAAGERAAEYSDARVTYYWDADRATALAWQELLALDKPAWDMYLLYPPDARWGEGVTPPALAMTGHEPVGETIPRMDIEVFAATARRLATR